MAHQIRDRGARPSQYPLTNYFRSVCLFGMNKHLKPDQNAQAQAIFDCGCVSYRQRFLKNKKFFKNRVPKCPLEDIYIIEACIAGSVYLRYMKHREQRQVTPAAVFRFCGNNKTDKAFVLCPFYLFNFELQPFCWFELRPSI